MNKEQMEMKNDVNLTWGLLLLIASYLAPNDVFSFIFSVFAVVCAFLFCIGAWRNL